MTSVLVLNAGSSSLKFVLVDTETGARSLSGIAERLGTSEATVTIKRGSADDTSALAGGDHHAAVGRILHETRHLDPAQQPVAVGHRVVHGGEEFAESVVVDDKVVDAIERFSALAPLHNPPALLGIKAVSANWPEVPQVAVFDTAFHQTMPAHAYRYAVPDEWYDSYSVRRYGFHGTSHRYVSGKAAELLGRPVGELAVVVAHLGNGCSATAVLGGESVDTTMGLTPLEGLVMGTRSGDIDPGVFGYLADVAGLTESEVLDVLNKRSGLLGVSGVSNDMRELATAVANGDRRAALAVDLFVYRLAKALAALVVALGRLDALVFTGGIGENNASVRSRVLERLGFLGLVVDPDANDGHGRTTGGRICRSVSPTALVVPTDEELMIALDTSRLTS